MSDIIDKNSLFNLYYNEKKTLQEIANIFDYTKNNIVYYMNKFGLKRRNFSEARKNANLIGEKSPNFGKRLSEERRRNISLSKGGTGILKPINNNCCDCNKNISNRAIRCISCSSKLKKGHEFNIYCQCQCCKAKRGEYKGEKNPNFGNHKLKGSKHPLYKDGRTLLKHYCIELNCNKEICYCTWYMGEKRCNSCNNKGKRNPNYRDGRTPLSSIIRISEEYKLWRKKVFCRDNYRCVNCFTKENIVCHHKKEFCYVLDEFLSFYSQFSPIEDKETLVRLSLSWKDFWDINNGKTLCEKCHKLTFKGKYSVRY